METEWITPDGKWLVTAEVVNGVVVLDFEELDDLSYSENQNE
jgi:hypothetical protein